jgi:hypothetical protein
MVLQSWGDLIVSSLQTVWVQVASFIPNLVVALIFLVIGLIIAAGLGALVEKIIDAIKLDTLLRRAGVEQYVERAGMRMSSGRFLGQTVYWFFVLVTLLAVAGSLGLTAFASYLESVVGYIPHIVAAVLIVLAAAVIANFLRKLVRGSILSARLHAANFLGGLTWWAVFLVGLAAGLRELGVGQVFSDYLGAVLQGVVLMVALAFGLAFGLGGKEYAAHLIERFRSHYER